MNLPYMMTERVMSSHMKNLTLKAKKRDESLSENEESDDKEDPFILITRGLEA